MVSPFEKIAPASLIDRVPAGGLEHLPRKPWPFLWFFLRQMWVPFAVITVFYSILNMTFISHSLFIGQFIQIMSDHATTRESIWQAILKLFLVYVVFVEIGGRVMGQFGHKLESRTLPIFLAMIRRQLSVYLHKHSYRYFQEDFAGSLAGRVLEMPQALSATMLDLINPFLFSTSYLLGSVILFAWIDGSFAACGIAYCLAYVGIMVFSSPHIKALSTRAADSRNILRGGFVDVLSNMLLVKVFARHHYEDRRLSLQLHDVARRDQAENYQIVRTFRYQHILNASFTVLVLSCATQGYAAGGLTIGQAASAIGLGVTVVNNSWWLLTIFSQFFGRMGEIQNGINMLVKVQDVTDKPGASALTVTVPSIRFDHVTFSYPGRPVFEDLTLDIPPLQKVGLIGPSGGGKSTFFQLLLRLHDLQSGSISIDNRNIADFTQDSVREAIAFIPQSTDLLHRSVADNIRYGRLDASDEEIIAAAKRSHAHDFIVGLEDGAGRKGYEAMVGERGVKLSGGQRQRLAMARAILKNAPILLLDEATSALDSESERLIQKSLEDLMRDRTVIVIAHRLSTVTHLDRLIVLDRGQIVEDGSHARLIANNGLYARLWNLQSEGFLPKTL